MSGLLIIFAFVLVLGFIIAALVWQYTLADYLFPVWLLMPLWLRSQFSLKVSFFFMGQVYLGEIWVALGIGVLCLLARSVRQGPKMRVAPSMLWVVLLMVVSTFLAVGLAPSAEDGLAKALQANLMWTAAFIGALGLVALVPTTEEHHDRLIRSFVGAFGYVFPLLMIAMALVPSVFSRYFEWDVNWTMVHGEFTRAPSPVGSGITAGLLAMMAMALAVGQILRGRSVWFYAPVLFVGTTAILFSLARSVLVAVAVFALIYFFRMMMRNLGRTVAMGLVALVLLSPLAVYLSSRYDLSRLTDFREIQQSLRYQSAVGAWNAFQEKPATGHGVGQTYHLVRVPGLLQEDFSGRIERVISVGGMPSAREPHNMYLLILVEYGGVGLLLFGLGMFFWLRTARRARRVSDHNWVSISDAYWAAGIAWLVFLMTNSDPLLNTKSAFGMWAFFFMALHNSQVVERQADLVCEAELWSQEADEQEAAPVTTGAGR